MRRRPGRSNRCSMPRASGRSTWGPGSRPPAAGDQRWFGGPRFLTEFIALNPAEPLLRRRRRSDKAIALTLDRPALAALFGQAPSSDLLPPSVLGGSSVGAPVADPRPRGGEGAHGRADGHAPDGDPAGRGALHDVRRRSPTRSRASSHRSGSPSRSSGSTIREASVRDPKIEGRPVRRRTSTPTTRIRSPCSGCLRDHAWLPRPTSPSSIGSSVSTGRNGSTQRSPSRRGSTDQEAWLVADRLPGLPALPQQERRLRLRPAGDRGGRPAEPVPEAVDREDARCERAPRRPAPRGGRAADRDVERAPVRRKTAAATRMNSSRATRPGRRPRRELRTFLIADIRGYTTYTREHGDDAAADARRPVRGARGRGRRRPGTGSCSSCAVTRPWSCSSRPGRRSARRSTCRPGSPRQNCREASASASMRAKPSRSATAIEAPHSISPRDCAPRPDRRDPRVRGGHPPRGEDGRNQLRRRAIAQAQGLSRTRSVPSWWCRRIGQRVAGLRRATARAATDRRRYGLAGVAIVVVVLIGGFSVAGSSDATDVRRAPRSRRRRPRPSRPGGRRRVHRSAWRSRAPGSWPSSTPNGSPRTRRPRSKSPSNISFFADGSFWQASVRIPGR